AKIFTYRLGSLIKAFGIDEMEPFGRHVPNESYASLRAAIQCRSGGMMMFVICGLHEILTCGLVGSLRLSGCRCSNGFSFLDWLGGDYKVHEEWCLRPQMTQARQRYSVQG